MPFWMAEPLSSGQMRILRVAQKAYPEHTGGGAYHVHAMSRDQAAMGHDVTVLTVGDGPRREEHDGYMVIRCPSRVSLLGNDIAPGVWSILRKDGRQDVIHAHSHLYFSTNLTALRRYLGETPLAITNHGLYSQNAPKWLFNFYLRSLGRWTFNQAEVVLCYTDKDRERVRKFGVNSRIEVVSNGIDTGRFTPESEESNLIDCDGAVVLFVGRLVDGKRPQDAIQAVSQLSEEMDIHLYIAGEGPLRDDLEEMVDESVVTFLGHVPYDEMAAMYRTSDVLLLPSRAEGLPRTILEAMASGVPVVVSDLEQVAPVVNGGGVTVPVGDIDGFASGIKAVLNDDYADPRSVVEGSFDWTKTVERTTDELKRLVSDDR